LSEPGFKGLKDNQDYLFLHAKILQCDFMFKLTKNEINKLVSQNVIPSKQHLGGAIPYVFSETGVSMLSSVLKSKKAIQINIATMRTFVKLRKMLFNYKELLKKQEDIERKVSEQSNQIILIFKYLKQFEKEKQNEFNQKN